MRFQRERRLRVRPEFDNVFKKGRRLGGRLFVMLALPNGRREHRVGLAVSRKVGNAVVRNRARRLLREGFRRLERPGEQGLDLVIVARPDIVGRSQAEVEGEIRDRVRRLLDPGGSRRRSPAGSH